MNPGTTLGCTPTSIHHSFKALVSVMNLKVIKKSRTIHSAPESLRRVHFENSVQVHMQIHYILISEHCPNREKPKQRISRTSEKCSMQHTFLSSAVEDTGNICMVLRSLQIKAGCGPLSFEVVETGRKRRFSYTMQGQKITGQKTPSHLESAYCCRGN